MARSVSFLFLGLALVVGGSQAFISPSFNGRSVHGSVGPKGSTTIATKTTKTGLCSSRQEPKRRGPDEVTETEIAALFSLWNNALATGESKIVARRYAKDAVLLPAASDVPRMDYESIKEYYDEFLLKQPQKRVLERRIKIGEGWAQDVGICEITMRSDENAGGINQNIRRRARYTFLYIWEDNQWRIMHHHSSAMPEDTPPNEMTVDRVRNLFYLWNDALDTLNADTAARRFHKNAVLLPTISDIPRTDYQSIKAYYEEFLQYKPQARIVESHVTIKCNYAKDCGIYELTMGVDGTKTLARYSFDYSFEDGRWLISHHHSSPMPESTWKSTVSTKDYVGSRISKDEVGDLFGKWQEAITSGNSTRVVDLYTREAVVMSTVSPTPKTGRLAIEDYYDSFLLNQPRVQLEQSFVTINQNFCKDAGVLEFELGNKGIKVQERYSFLYVLEDGEWKIAYHHSSTMSEDLLTAVRMASGEDDENPNWQ